MVVVLVNDEGNNGARMQIKRDELSDAFVVTNTNGDVRINLKGGGCFDFPK